MMIVLTEQEYLALKNEGSKVDIEEKIASAKRAMAGELAHKVTEFAMRRHTSVQELLIYLQTALRELTE